MPWALSRPPATRGWIGVQAMPRRSSPSMNFATAEERKEQIGEVLKNVFSFTILVGFLALFLGAVGVASAMHVYVRQKIATVAVLRCIGASARTSFAIYLLQGLGIGIRPALEVQAAAARGEWVHVMTGASNPSPRGRLRVPGVRLVAGTLEATLKQLSHGV